MLKISVCNRVQDHSNARTQYQLAFNISLQYDVAICCTFSPDLTCVDKQTEPGMMSQTGSILSKSNTCFFLFSIESNVIAARILTKINHPMQARILSQYVQSSPKQC